MPDIKNKTYFMSDSQKVFDHLSGTTNNPVLFKIADKVLQDKRISFDEGVILLKMLLLVLPVRLQIIFE